MRGGKRPGAGRPKGTPNKRTQEIAAKVMAAGMTPLEVMIEAMRTAYEAGDLDKAAERAKDAAPYVHPRLAAVEHSADKDSAPVFQLISGVPRVEDDQRPVPTHGHTH